MYASSLVSQQRPRPHGLGPRAVAPGYGEYGGTPRDQGNEQEQRVEEKEVDSNIALTAAQPAAPHGVLVGRVEQPRRGGARHELALRDPIEHHEQTGGDESKPRLSDEDRHQGHGASQD